MPSDAPPPPTDRPRFERLLPLGVALLLVAWCLREDVQPDLYFHLAAGRWILAHGLPDTNVFLAPYPEHPFVDHEWLFQAAAWPLFALGGAPALTAVKTLAVGAAMAALVLACRRASPQARWWTVIAALTVAGGRFILRPEVASFLGVALTLALLARDGRRPSRLTLIALPALQAVWGNVHGFALLGPALVGVTAAAALAHAGLARLPGRAGRLAARLPGGVPSRGDLARWALLLALVVVASCLNPYGLEAALYPFWVLFRASEDAASAGLSYRVVELASPFAPGVRAAPEVRLYLLWLALGLPLWAVALARGRARLREGAWGLLLVASSVLYLRNLPFAALGLAPLTAAGLTALGELAAGRLGARRAERGRRALAALGCAVALLGARAVLADRWHRNASYDARPGLGLGAFPRHDEAVAFLEAHPPAGALFNNFGAGHFLTWARGVREPKPFISGNTDLYPRAHLRRYHELMRGELPLAPELERLGVSDVLLDHRVEVEDRVLRELLAHPRWALVHADRRALVLRRRDALGDARPLDTAALAAAARAWEFADEAPDRFAPTRALRALGLLPARDVHPIERLNTARLLDLVGRPRAALDLARRALELAPRSPLALQVLGDLEQYHGSKAAAAERYAQLAALAPGDPLPRVKLGLLALARGAPAEAVRHLRAALALDPDARLARENLLAALEAAADPIELRRALAAQPELAPARRAYYRGVAALLESELERATRFLAEAVAADPSLAPALARLAEVEGRLGRLEAAERSWERLCALTPSDASAHRALGRLRLIRGDSSGALAAWSAAAAADPAEVDALLLAAQLHLHQGRASEARALAERALERQPGHPGALRIRQEARGP